MGDQTGEDAKGGIKMKVGDKAIYKFSDARGWHEEECTIEHNQESNSKSICRRSRGCRVTPKEMFDYVF